MMMIMDDSIDDEDLVLRPPSSSSSSRDYSAALRPRSRSGHGGGITDKICRLNHILCNLETRSSCSSNPSPTLAAQPVLWPPNLCSTTRSTDFLHRNHRSHSPAPAGLWENRIAHHAHPLQQWQDQPHFRKLHTPTPRCSSSNANYPDYPLKSNIYNSHLTPEMKAVSYGLTRDRVLEDRCVTKDVNPNPKAQVAQNHCELDLLNEILVRITHLESQQSEAANKRTLRKQQRTVDPRLTKQKEEEEEEEGILEPDRQRCREVKK